MQSPLNSVEFEEKGEIGSSITLFDFKHPIIFCILMLLTGLNN
jgi:hypothetical protein